MLTNERRNILKKAKFISVALSIVSISMVAIGVMLQSESVLKERVNIAYKYKDINVNNMALHAGAIIEKAKKEAVSYETYLAMKEAGAQITKPTTKTQPPC